MLGKLIYVTGNNLTSHRKYHREPIYSNGFQISLENNIATFWLQNHGDYIGVVIQGVNPTQLLNKVKELVKDTCYIFPAMKLHLSFICPKCLIDMISKENKYEELPANIIRSRFTEQELNEASKQDLCCSQNRHFIQPSFILNGYLPTTHIATTDSAKETKLIQGMHKYLLL